MSERMNVVSKAVATIEPAENDAHDPVGSFHVLLSTAAEDRDGDTLSLDEWQTPLPDHITFDSDHLMSVAGTVGSGQPVLTERGIEVTGTYSSIPEAQKVRTLVNEGHIRTTSVAFMVTKAGKGPGAKTVRELLNGAFVAVPSNRDALVLSHKGVTQKVGQRNSASDMTAIQNAHDLLSSLGAECDPDGSETSQTTGRDGNAPNPRPQVNGPVPVAARSANDAETKTPVALVEVPAETVTPEDTVEAAHWVNQNLMSVPEDTTSQTPAPEPSETDDAWLLNSQATILAALAAS